MTLEECNGELAANATGAFLFSGEALRKMIPAASGAIVNVGSYACYQAFPTLAAYASSKGALAQLTRASALEAIEHGIHINAVGAGDVVTNLANDVKEDGRKFLAEHGKGAPIGRAAEPREIAEIGVGQGQLRCRRGGDGGWGHERGDQVTCVVHLYIRSTTLRA